MNKLSSFIIASVISLLGFVAIGTASSEFRADFARVLATGTAPAPLPTAPSHCPRPELTC
jgi:hypothetical protein